MLGPPLDDGDGGDGGCGVHGIETVSNVDCAGIILSAGWICLWQVWGGDNGVADSEESAVQGHHRPELKNVFWQMWDPHCGYAPPVRTHHG